MMSHRKRVLNALSGKPVDRVPVDFAAEPEIWELLKDHFKVETNYEVLEWLDTDCRLFSYDWEIFCHPPKGTRSQQKMSLWKHWIDENTFEDVWGARRRMITNEYGSHTCLIDYPLAQADSVDELKQYPWPEPSWWDFSSLPNVVKIINPQQEYHLRYRMGSIFETAWSLCGLDTMLVNLALKPQLAEYMMDRILEVHAANLTQVMELSQDQIDMVYLYDDLAQQNGLLMSEPMWRQIIAPRQKKLFDLAHSHGKSVMMHTCGDIGPLIKVLSEIGVDLLNPVQTSAMKMDYPEIKSKFGDWIAFHGGIDIQQFLPNATPQEVRQQVQKAKELLGQGGGYILAPTHHIQADTPLENILTMYDE